MGRDQKCGAGRRPAVGPDTELEMRVEISRSLGYHVTELKIYQQLLNGIKMFTEITPYFIGFCFLLLMSEISKYTTHSCRLLINH